MDAPTRRVAGSMRLQEKHAFTPWDINRQCCMARTWNQGRGGQCPMPRREGDFCKIHASNGKWRVHGRVDGSVPESKLEEFRKHTRKRRASEFDTPVELAKAQSAVNAHAARVPKHKSILMDCMQAMPMFGGHLAQLLWQPFARRPDLAPLLEAGHTCQVSVIVGIKDYRCVALAAAGSYTYMEMCDKIVKTCQRAWKDSRRLRTHTTCDADLKFARRRLLEHQASTVRTAESSAYGGC
eukprot:TRINITY_DN37419_c0_g1_i1.p1 TRINITY_DN37419_c0_g1~~TRINITY_DN37419_c0_g1_i1.p1  ORF type:complete len:239 (+),score=24.05 TRINITY_DN37419_c0_g1_i1:160-876(+)